MRHAFQPLHHLVWDNNSFVLQSLSSSRMSLLYSVSDEILEIFSHSSVHDVEEVFSLRKPSLGQFIREVSHEGSVDLHMRPQLCNWELIIVRYIHHLDLTHWHELLLTRYYLSEEIFVAHELWGSIELTLKIGLTFWKVTYLLGEEVEEVILGWEFVSYLGREHSFLAKAIPAIRVTVHLNH